MPVSAKPIALLSLLLVAAAGCAGSVEDDPIDEAAAASTSVAAYDAVIRNGTKVDTVSTEAASLSASTRLLGWIPRATPSRVLEQLFAVSKWPEIRDAEGEQPFTAASVLSRSGTGDTRNLTVKLALSAGIELSVRATSKREDEKIVVSFVNTSGYSHWFMGTILESRKLEINLQLIPYKDGVIVDATAKAKLAQMESRAPELTRSIQPIFEWTKKNTR
ncbi:MAG: hypothetical protein KF819_10945 [Labilithrix sp.]|nr:hypothetical protein [Labilithrix sp.]